MRDRLRDWADDVDRQQVIVALLALLVVGAPVAYAATGIFTAGSTFKTDSGLSIKTQQDQSLTGNPFTDAYTFDGDGGTVVAQGAGDGYVEVAQWQGDNSAKTDVQEINLTTTGAVFKPDNGDQLGIQGNASRVVWDTIAADDGLNDVIVQGTNGPVTLTIYDVEPDQPYQLVGDSGVVDRSVAGSDGSVEFSVQSGQYNLESFDNELPSLTNLEPDGDIVTDSVTLAADVDDDTLPQDNVTVTFRVNGDVVHTTTISSAQRVNYTLTQSELPGTGRHSWSVTAEDFLGAESTSSSDFAIPGEIVVRNVSNSSERIPGVNATVYTENSQITLTSDADGVIPLDTLPGGEALVMELKKDGWKDRTTVIPSVIQANDAYLMPENNTSTVQNRFTINDPSGEFGSDSIVYISQPIEQNNTTDWRTVSADQFGVEGFTATLEQGQRYRIRIVSASGEVAQMGKFTAEQTEEIPLRPQSPAVELQDGPSIGYSANVTAGDLHIEYYDPQNKTDVLTVYAVSRFNDSKLLFGPETFYGTNSLVIDEPVGELDDSYVVIMEVQRDGVSSTIRVPIGPDQISLLPGGLSDVWVQIGAVGMLLMVGGVFSRLNAGAGAIITSTLGGIFWYLGLLSGVATWASVAIAITFSVLYAMVIQR